MEYAFYLGMDIKDGQAVWSLVEKEADDAKSPARYRVHRTVSFGKVEEDDEQVACVEEVQDEIADQPYLGRTIVVVNRSTEAGREILHELNERGLTPIGIHFTGGQGASQEGSGAPLEGGDDAARDESSFFVSEQTLAERLVRLQHEGRLEPSQEDTEDASRLAQGIQSYRALFDEREATEEAEALGEADQQAATEPSGDAASAPTDETSRSPQRQAKHSAYALSVALACWLGEEHAFDPTEHLSGDPPPMGEAKREQRPDTAS